MLSIEWFRRAVVLTDEGLQVEVDRLAGSPGEGGLVFCDNPTWAALESLEAVDCYHLWRQPNPGIPYRPTGCLAHKKLPPLSDHRGALSIVLL